MDQGEGNPGPYVDADRLEKDHYAVFEELQNSPKFQWETYPVIEEPKTNKYHSIDIRLYQVRCYV